MGKRPEFPGLSPFARQVQDRGCRVASRLSRALTARQQEQQQQMGTNDAVYVDVTTMPMAGDGSDGGNVAATADVRRQGSQTCTGGGDVTNAASGGGAGHYQRRELVDTPPESCTSVSRCSAPSSAPSLLPSSVGVAVVTASSPDETAALLRDRSSACGSGGGVGVVSRAHAAAPVTVGQLQQQEQQGEAVVIVGVEERQRAAFLNMTPLSAAPGRPAGEEGIIDDGMVRRVWQEDEDERVQGDTDADVRRGVLGGGAAAAVMHGLGECEEDESLAEHYDPAM